MTEWAKRYIENKDIIAKKIVSIEKTDLGLLVKYSDRELTVISAPFIKDVDALLQKIQNIPNYRTLVVLNSPENIDLVVKNWDRFVSLGAKFNIYFVNPFSKTEKIWIICPYTHNFIADTDSLALGLKTMSENVEYVTSEEEIRKIIES